MRKSIPHLCLAIALAIVALSLSPLPTASGVENWPNFRGPTGQGLTDDDTKLPTEWAEDKNIVWKTAVEGRAWSSPVVWGKQIWMTTASEDRKAMGALCLDRDSDKVVGCHMIGGAAGELVQVLGVAIKAGATKAMFDSTIGIHPTAAEEFVTMREPWTED